MQHGTAHKEKACQPYGTENNVIREKNLLMKKVVLMMVALLGTFVAKASDYDYPYLTIQSTDGTTQSLDVTSLKITFDDGQLVATNASGSQSFTLSSLSKMYFTESASAITTAVGQIPTAGETNVYTVGGIFVGSFDSMEQAKNSLTKGVYVMKSNQKTFKIAVK